MDYYGLHGAGLSGLVATALRFNAVKIWELFWGGGWGFWWVFERKQSWQMLRSQWDLNVPRMRFLLLQIQERGFYFREGFVV